MIKYYPLTRIKPNLYTRGNEYRLPNGESYVGRYYLTYDLKAFTGINPIVGTNELLTRISQLQPLINAEINSIARTSAVERAFQTDQYTTEQEIELGQLKPYYPLPLESDYARGYFTRYFAKNPSGPGFVVEISETDWSQIQNGLTQPTLFEYESVSLLWQLTGPLHDTRVSQYQVKGGVYDTNKRVTEAKAVGFVGLLAFIGGNYTKFARITPDVATTGSR